MPEAYADEKISLFTDVEGFVTHCVLPFICFCQDGSSKQFPCFIAFLYANLPVLLRPTTAVMATKSRHFSEVMATVQITVVAEEKRGTDLFFFFFWLWSFTMQNICLFSGIITDCGTRQMAIGDISLE